MARHFFSFGLLIVLLCACNAATEKTPELKQEQNTVSLANQKAQLVARGFELFDYVDAQTGDTIIMQKYFIMEKK